MKPGSVPCAIYTRKSSEEGLEQNFNSLDAQREACQAYIQSQKSLGWMALRADYSDGGFSGGTTDRPALQRLLADIALGKVKVVVVYKVDRLTRSLADFAKMVELFDAQGVSFVSVTQQFNTTSSMGRLTLNVLLSFAQFEREVTGERIRDKIAASKKKGMWMGGLCPLGYVPHERSLKIDEPQAQRVREIFGLYLQLGHVRALQAEIEHRGWRTPARVSRRQNATGDRPFSHGHLYRILRNPIYRGQIAHKGQVHPGNHPAIIDQETWEQVQRQLEENRQGEHHRRTEGSPNLLVGLLFDHEGNRFTPGHSNKGGRRYRYYVQQVDTPQPLRIPAPQLEQAVKIALLDYLGDQKRLLMDAGDDAPPTQVLGAASETAEQIQESDGSALRALLERVAVGDGNMVITVRAGLLWSAARTVQIELPIELKRAGLAMRLVIPSHRAKQRQPDPKLIRLLAKAHDWAMRLITGKAATVQEISEAEQVTGSFVTRVLQLCFLSPDLVQAMLRGEQPPDLTVQTLLTIGSVPLDWDEQRMALGMTEG